jgi:dTDP-4-amino-4,6-dideoxygalactose transaminase
MIGSPAQSRIHISQPALGADVESLVLSVLRSGHLAQGTMVARFEELCAEMAQTRHAVALCNGTVALEAALALCDIGPGDEVITSPFTFAATLNAILSRGATARFADIGDDFCVTPQSVAALVGPRTKVLLPVHLYGLMADMAAISEIATRHRLAIVEDAAQAHGAMQGSRHAGSLGLGVFSFYATKNVTSGEGGCVTTDDDALAEQLRVLRNQGMRARYEYLAIGRNWRMTDIAAAVAIPQMQRLEHINARRRANADALTELLADDERITTPRVPVDRTHVWHQYTVLLPEDADRNAVVAAMSAAGVDAGVYYPRLVWDYEAYRDHPGVTRDDTPFAASVARRCVSLPVHPGLDEADLELVASALLAALP